MTEFSKTESKGLLYRMLWRWHFYAGLVCIPFIIMLSITGSVYLFKPQVERALEAPLTHLQVTQPQAASAQVEAATKAVKGSRLRHYELPQTQTDAVKIMVAKNNVETLVYLNPQTLEVLRIVPKDGRFMEIAKTIHGELLMGKAGSWIVEIAACWAIVMMVTGLYLWWPRGAKGLGGVLYPRQGKLFMRDLHSVTGIWISFFAIFLLLSGLPWTDVWGKGFKEFRKITHTQSNKQEWTLSREEERKILMEEMGHSSHDAPYYHANIDDMVAVAYTKQMAMPVEVAPPNKKNKNWQVRSQSQNRMLRETYEYDPQNGMEKGHETFKDRHPIDKVTGVMISAHEGQLFGPLNQALGVLTAIALITMSVSAFIMWRRRTKNGLLGAPPPIPNQKIGFGFMVLILIFAVLLPLLGASLIVIALIERIILTQLPNTRTWLGLNPIEVKK